jgi:hypothetical protein
VNKLEARELDILIAEKVMGQTRAKNCPLGDDNCPGQWRPQVGRWPCLPPYSTNIEAAWEVAEKSNLFRFYALNEILGIWQISFHLSIGEKCAHSILAAEETAPLAICRGALVATGVELEKELQFRLVRYEVKL